MERGGVTEIETRDIRRSSRDSDGGIPIVVVVVVVVADDARGIREDGSTIFVPRGDDAIISTTGG